MLLIPLILGLFILIKLLILLLFKFIGKFIMEFIILVLALDALFGLDTLFGILGRLVSDLLPPKLLALYFIGTLLLF